MVRELFFSTLYVRVTRNQFRIRHIESKREVVISARKPFSTKRLLIGSYSNAEELLDDGIEKVRKGRWFPPPPIIVIQPLEMLEEGLSEVEERVLNEVAAAAGARKVVVWVGHELSDQEVFKRARSG